MTLTKNQIEHIKAYVDRKNIWYRDIKDEVLDHLICAVEQEMQQNQADFDTAFKRVSLSINPVSIQKAKLKTEHLRTFKQLYTTFIELLFNQPYLILLSIALAAVLTYTETLSRTISIYNTFVIAAVMYNFTIRTWRNKQFKPLQNVLFTSRLNALSLTAILTVQLFNLTISNYIESSPWIFMTYIAVFNIYAVASFKILNKSFLDLKNYGATY